MHDDFRFAIRQLSRKPLFAATAILTLAVGMGVNAVAFTVVNGLLFKGSATSGRHDVVRVFVTPGGDEGGYASIPDFSRFADATRGAMDVSAEGRSSVSWRHDGTSETAWVLYVSPNYFSMVNVEPIAGRLRVAPADGGTAAVVIGERFWREKLGAASIAGLTLRMNNADVSVAGVVPNSYTGPAGIYSPDVWLPLDDLKLFGGSPRLAARDSRWLYLFGRLQPGASLPQIQAQLDAATAEMKRDWPDTHNDRGVNVRMLGEATSEIRGITIAAGIGMGIIGLVLLLACFNVANLLLARAVERERDMGLRAALGAKPSRLIRLVVTEGFVIALASGALALLLAWWTQSLVGAFAIPIEEPQHINLSPDWRVAGFVIALMVIAGVLPGLWPALASARIDLVRALGAQGGTSSGGRPSLLRRGLVAAQIAGSTAFLALAGLFLQSFSALSASDVGFDRDRLIVTDVSPASQGLTATQSAQYIDALTARVAALPGVASVAAAERAPFFIGFARDVTVWPKDGGCENGACPKVPIVAVGPGYFRTMGITLVAGREFDRTGALAEVVVNQTLGRNLGDTIRIGDSGDLVTIVGITAKTHTRTINVERPQIWAPLTMDRFESEVSVIARTDGPPAEILDSFTKTARAVNPDISMHSIKTMERRMDVQLWPFHTVSWLFSICGGLALLMATVGLTGMVIYAVNRRLREFGVRMSVGATSADLIKDVLRGSAALLLPGVITGLILSAVAARLIQAALVGVNVLNPTTYLIVALLECAIVIVACLPPAIRASRVDPLTALRSE